DLVAGRLLEALHAAEARREELRRALAHHAYAEAVEDARQPAALRGLDGVDQIGGRLLRQALEARQLLAVEPVGIAEVLDHLPVHELVDHDFAQVLDVHRAPSAPVEETLLELRRARHVRAAPDRFAFRTLGRRAAGRAFARHFEGPGAFRALGGNHLDEVGDDVTGALDEDGIAHAHVFPAD